MKGHMCVIDKTAYKYFFTLQKCSAENFLYSERGGYNGYLQRGTV